MIEDRHASAIPLAAAALTLALPGVSTGVPLLLVLGAYISLYSQAEKRDVES